MLPSASNARVLPPTSVSWLRLLCVRDCAVPSVVTPVAPEPLVLPQLPSASSVHARCEPATVFVVETVSRPVVAGKVPVPLLRAGRERAAAEVCQPTELVVGAVVVARGGAVGVVQLGEAALDLVVLVQRVGVAVVAVLEAVGRRCRCWS